MNPITTRLPLALALALAACGPDAMSPGTDSPMAPEADPMQAARTLDGTIAQGDAALHASGTLATATDIRWTTVDADGTATSDTEATSEVDVDGRFAIEVDETDDRWLLVEAVDADGTAIGSALLELRDAEDGDALEIDAVSTVQAEVTAALVAGADDARHDQAWLEAHVDAVVAAAVHLTDDLEGQARAEADAAVDAWIDSLAEAADAAFETRAAFAAEIGLEASTDAMAEWTEDAAEEAEAEGSTDLGAALEARLQAEGLTATERDAYATLTELAFRAALETGAEARDGADATETGGRTVLDAALDASAELEAEIAAAVAADLFARADSEVDELPEDSSDDEQDRAEATRMLAADVLVSLDTEAEDLDDGDTAEASADDHRMALETSAEASFQTWIGLLSDEDEASLLFELDLDVTADLVLAAEEAEDRFAERSDTLWLTLTSETDASTDAEGEVDGERLADAMLDAWIDFEADVTAYADEMQDDTATETEVAILLHAYSHFLVTTD